MIFCDSFPASDSLPWLSLAATDTPEKLQSVDPSTTKDNNDLTIKPVWANELSGS